MRSHGFLIRAVLTASVALGVASLSAASGDREVDTPGDYTEYGAGLTLTRPLGVAAVLAAPDKHTSKPVLLQGRISDVCQRKGCWTILSEGDASLRVRFKDYGFFLPPDVSGRQAFVEGRVQVETLSEKTARHYASESKDGDADSIRGPQREVGFIATGVRILARR